MLMMQIKSLLKLPNRLFAGVNLRNLSRSWMWLYKTEVVDRSLSEKIHAFFYGCAADDKSEH